MARDITIEADVVPILNEKQTEALIRKAQRLVSKVGTARYTQSAAELQSLSKIYSATQVAKGVASTTTAARIQFDQLAGVTGNKYAQARSRAGSEQAKLALSQGRITELQPFSQRQIGRFTATNQRLARTYNDLAMRYMDNPSPVEQKSLLKENEKLRNQLAKLYKEYHVNGKKVPQYLQKISEGSSVLRTQLGNSQKGGGVGSNALMGMLSKIGLIGAAIKGGEYILNVVDDVKEAGRQALINDSIWGPEGSYGRTRALSEIYGIDRKSVAATEEYAQDFRQRMMYGEVSEKEWIALSKMGPLGKAIISGKAMSDPYEYNKMLKDYMANNSGAEVRQNLKWLGLPLDIMAMNAQHWPKEDYDVTVDAYKRYISAKKAMYLEDRLNSNIVNQLTNEIGKLAMSHPLSWLHGEQSKQFVGDSMKKGVGWAGEEIAREEATALQVGQQRKLWDEAKDRHKGVDWSDVWLTRFMYNHRYIPLFALHSLTYSEEQKKLFQAREQFGEKRSYDYAFPELSGWGKDFTPSVNINQNITVQGNMDKDTATTVSEKTKEAVSQSVTDAQTRNIMNGMVL